MAIFLSQINPYLLINPERIEEVGRNLDNRWYIKMMSGKIHVLQDSTLTLEEVMDLLAGKNIRQ